MGSGGRGRSGMGGEEGGCCVLDGGLGLYDGLDEVLREGEGPKADATLTQPSSTTAEGHIRRQLRG